MMKINSNLKGFTLVETLVSLFIFGMMSVALVNIFVSGTNTQGRILKNQELMNQSSYALERMSKAIRMATVDATGDCVGTAGENYGLGSNAIYFLSFDSKLNDYLCREFLLEDNVIKERRSADTTRASLATAQDLTATSVKVDDLTFNVTGDTVGDLYQPRVTIMVKMESNSTLLDGPYMTVQTSVSQRRLDII
jgi:prepilin-type N-terminal cleavage/methylation domain-containing protein